MHSRKNQFWVLFRVLKGWVWSRFKFWDRIRRNHWMSGRLGGDLRWDRFFIFLQWGRALTLHRGWLHFCHEFGPSWIWAGYHWDRWNRSHWGIRWGFDSHRKRRAWMIRRWILSLEGTAGTVATNGDVFANDFALSPLLVIWENFRYGQVCWPVRFDLGWTLW